jgi:hypothetical protein
VLSRHDPDVQDWGKLSADERRLYARMMEVFAGFLEHTDHQIGRLIEYLAAIGELDNTVIMLISDNGASAEGGPNGSTNENKFFNNVPDDLKENLAALAGAKPDRGEIGSSIPIRPGCSRRTAEAATSPSPRRRSKRSRRACPTAHSTGRSRSRRAYRSQRLKFLLKHSSSSRGLQWATCTRRSSTRGQWQGEGDDATIGISLTSGKPG